MQKCPSKYGENWGENKKGKVEKLRIIGTWCAEISNIMCVIDFFLQIYIFYIIFIITKNITT